MSGFKSKLQKCLSCFQNCLSWPTCFSQTGRTFFYNYPSLYQFLLDEIAMATENIHTQLHPGLFPVLMVLGRLFPSAMEGTDTNLNLAAFIPYVIKYAAFYIFITLVFSWLPLLYCKPKKIKPRLLFSNPELLAVLVSARLSYSPYY